MENNIVINMPGRDGKEETYYINQAMWQTQRDWYLAMENAIRADLVKKNQELYNLKINGRK